jgi:hypothetical protein
VLFRSGIMARARTLCLLGLLSLIAATGALHCGGSTITAGNPDGGVPAVGPPPGPPPAPLGPPDGHRVSADACPTTRSAGVALDAGSPDSGGFIYSCANDSQCTMGTNGRCLPPMSNAGYYCSYDECTTDDNCATAHLCACGTPLGINGSDGMPMRSGNRCLPSNCRVDSDCGPGGYCSPTVDPGCGPRYGTTGYYCHTASDACTTDAQCQDAGATVGPGPGFCAYDPAAGQWACHYGFCSG